ncbi:MAG: hypothetical protein R6V06_05875 [Kiritimatiellia bacterium]
MKTTVISIISLFFAMSHVAAARQDLTVLKFREPGDRLDQSIINELEHTEDIGADWLKKKQNSNGSFGEKNPAECTPVVMLALSHKGAGNVVFHALKWLTDNSSGNYDTTIHSAAWQYAAVAVADTGGRYKALLRKNRECLIRRKKNLEGISLSLVNEILLSVSPPCNTADSAVIKTDDTDFSDKYLSYLKMWLKARSINRAGRQVSDRNGNPIDWRRIYAHRLISSQKIGSDGGGSWPGKNSDDTIMNTAMALLIIKEL